MKKNNKQKDHPEVKDNKINMIVPSMISSLTS
ncbi:Uncharacterised protein [Legionella pneumophila]|nr:Uncharacterised protein [Legionella pneumophila]SFZ45517.1 Uncharacterised protein [Legionella pneumophila]